MVPREGEGLPISGDGHVHVDQLAVAELPDEPALLEKMARLGVGNWDLRHAFELLADEVGQFVEHDCASLLTYQRQRGALLVQAMAPIGGTRLVRGLQVPADGPVADLLNGSLSAAVCMDTASSCCTLECYLYESNLKSCITVPLIAESRLVGLLNLSSRRRGQFQSPERASLHLLQRPLAVALQHVLANERPAKVGEPRFFERSTELERMRSVHELSGSIAHRLNNVFASVLGNARLALDSSPNAEASKYLQGARIVHAMQEFAASQAPSSASKVDLDNVIEGVVKITDGLWQHQVQSQQIRLECATDHNVACAGLANAPELREATVNLVFNAIQALPNGGTISLTTENKPPWAVIKVADDGVGMDEQTVRRCTAPFFTTRENAYGLGLSIATGVARKYGGHLEIVSELGKGTEVRILLPAADHGT